MTHYSSLHKNLKDIQKKLSICWIKFLQIELGKISSLLKVVPNKAKSILHFLLTVTKMDQSV